MVNILERGETVLIAENGIWGQRAADMAGRQGKKDYFFNQKSRILFKKLKMQMKFTSLLNPKLEDSSLENDKMIFSLILRRQCETS